MWTQTEAIELCRKLFAITPMHGMFPALTGGLLYKDGERKDCDIILYRHRQMNVNLPALGEALGKLGIKDEEGSDLWNWVSNAEDMEIVRWCNKALLNGKRIDFLLPDFDGPYNGADGSETELEDLI